MVGESLGGMGCAVGKGSVNVDCCEGRMVARAASVVCAFGGGDGKSGEGGIRRGKKGGEGMKKVVVVNSVWAVVKWWRRDEEGLQGVAEGVKGS